MSAILQKSIVLHLNRLWQPLGHVPVEKALNMMFSQSRKTGGASAMAMDITYELNADGSFNTDRIVDTRLVPVEEWLTLPVRPFDISLGTPRGPVRMPTVIVSVNYEEMPMTSAKCTKHAIRERDGNICQASGRKLGKGEGSVDHIVPQAAGGKLTWENCVWMDKRLNARKGKKSLRESGLRLLRNPTAPKSVPVCAKVTVAHHPDQAKFVTAA
jgi:hypothetical protein